MQSGLPLEGAILGGQLLFYLQLWTCSLHVLMWLLLLLGTLQEPSWLVVQLVQLLLSLSNNGRCASWCRNWACSRATVSS